MKTSLKLSTLAVLLSTISFPLFTAIAQSTAFTYQGQLNDGAEKDAAIKKLKTENEALIQRLEKLERLVGERPQRSPL